MKKRKSVFGRHALSLALSLVMCLGMLQTTAFAAEDEAAATEPTTQTETVPDTSVPEPEEPEDGSDADVDTDTDVDVNTDTNADVDTDLDVDVDNNTNADANVNVGEGADKNVNVNTDTDVKVDTDTKPGTPNYATVEELQAAFEAASEALESEDVEGTIAAINKYLSIYNRLSLTDQIVDAAGYAAMLTYQEVLKGSLEGMPDPELEKQAAKWHTIILVSISTNSYSSKITYAKVQVGQKVNGYGVTKVSGTTIKVKAWGDLYGDFVFPNAADLWNGAVRSDYVTWAGVGSGDNTEGDTVELPRNNASAYYYFNTPESVSREITYTVEYHPNGGSGEVQSPHSDHE